MNNAYISSHLLTRHPEVLARVRKEISSVAGSKVDLTRDDLKKMTYLADVLKESMCIPVAFLDLCAKLTGNAALRLFPPVPVNTRTAYRNTTLPTGGGPDGTSPVLVRKGENVAYCVYVMQRRKDLYGEDSHAFRPERWVDEDLPLHKDRTNTAWVSTSRSPFRPAWHISEDAKHVPLG